MADRADNGPAATYASGVAPTFASGVAPIDSPLATGDPAIAALIEKELRRQ